MVKLTMHLSEKHDSGSKFASMSMKARKFANVGYFFPNVTIIPNLRCNNLDISRLANVHVTLRITRTTFGLLSDIMPQTSLMILHISFAGLIPQATE